MAILGKIDTTPLDPVTVADEGGGVGVTVTGGPGFTDPTNANYIEAGDILEIANAPHVVYSVTDTTTLVLKRSATAVVGAAAARRTAPKEVADYMLAAGDSFTGELLCVSLAEAQDPGTRSRGITGPGWWYYKTFVDVAGNTRHKAECIASFKIGTVGGNAGVIGDDELLNDGVVLEETVASEASGIITVAVLADASANESNPGVTDVATFGAPGANTTTAGGGTATIFYQWQRKPVGGRFTNIPGENGDVLNLTGLTVDDNNGDQYRLKVSDEAGSPEVITNAATLTVTLT